jgi:arylsulfatase A-like enzyme
MRCRSSELIIDHTMRFVEKNKNRSFLVNVWLNDTHAILDPSEEQLEPYRNLRPQFVGNQHWGAPAIYYSVVTEADRQIGRLMTRLDELGLSENTIVIFSSDNGPEDICIMNASHSGVGSSGPFRGRKRSLYEGGVRTPFILRWPAGGVRACAIDNETPLCGIDLLPTFCKLAGVELSRDLQVDGEDMSDVFRGTKRHRTTPMMWEWRFHIAGHCLNRSPMLAMRQGDWKLLMNPSRDRVELFHIPGDPMELNNLAQQHPHRVEEMTEALLAWHADLPEGPISPSAGSNAYPWPELE